jgi:hypothetical protein
VGERRRVLARGGIPVLHTLKVAVGALGNIASFDENEQLP